MLLRNLGKEELEKKLVKRFLQLKPVRNCKEIWVHSDSIEEEKLLEFYKEFGFKKVAITMLRKQ